MSAFKPQQRHLTIQGRIFHFVSYEGQAANATRNQEERPDMWYLMVEGRRCPVSPCDATQTEVEVDQFLARWATDNAIGPAATTRSEAPRVRPVIKRRLHG